MTFKTLAFRVLDPITIEITLNAANSQFPRIVSRQLGFIASPAALQAAGGQDAYNATKPVGAGPFLLQSWSRDNQMVLVRNPYYWNAPRPYLDSLVFRVMSDPAQQRENALKAGTGDLTTATPTNSLDLGKTFNVLVSPAVNTTGFVMQQGHAPFSDKSLRRAMMLALDVDEYNRVIGQNTYETAHSMFPTNYPSPTRLSPIPSPIWRRRNGWSTTMSTLGTTVATSSSATYVSSAPQAEAGCSAGAVPNPAPQARARDAEAGHERSAGCQPHRWREGFDAGTLTYTGVDPEPEFTEAVTCKGSRNLYDYCNPAVDQAVAETRTTLDSAARVQALKTVQRLFGNRRRAVHTLESRRFDVRRQGQRQGHLHLRRRWPSHRPHLAQVIGPLSPRLTAFVSALALLAGVACGRESAAVAPSTTTTMPDPTTTSVVGTSRVDQHDGDRDGAGDGGDHRSRSRSRIQHGRPA